MSSFFFQLHTNMHYGPGKSLELGGILEQNGYRRVLVLVDAGVAAHAPYFARILEILKAGADSVQVLTLRDDQEPDYDYLDEVAAKARAAMPLDVLIGIGGGSCLDITKAVAVLLTNPGKGIEYRGFHQVKTPGVPTIAIPTTAGTGSEVTINAVFTDKKEMRKLGINGRYLDATHAVLDARWTMSCPHGVAVSSGMDAMTHTLESFICRQHNELTRMYSKEAFRLLYVNLPALADDPDNENKRQGILLGAHLAAIALFNSGSGIAGGFSYPIGVHQKAPHGMAGAVFLASVTRFNVERGYTDYAELLDLVEDTPGLDAAAKSRLFVDRLQALADKLGVPHTMECWGLTRDNAPAMAKLLEGLQGAFDQNPVPFSATEDAKALLDRHVR
ncbi:iron-containing alcohol dehydrogenase [Fundidesulfovibrio butyratiphilus]